MTFNFRGYCPGGEAGCSQGEKTISAIWQDVEGAVAALRDEGAARVGLVGASMGGTAALVAASQEGQDIDAVVTWSAPTSFEGLAATPDVLAQVTAAKLFLAGHEDIAAAEAVDTLYAETLQPKRPVILTTGDATDLAEAGNRVGRGATIGRPAVPEDIANAALFLASAEAGYVSGAVLVVDAAAEVIGDKNLRFVEMGATIVQEAGRNEL